MIDSPPSSQAKGSTAGRPQRIHKRRDAKLAYHSISRYFNHHSFPAVEAASSSARDPNAPRPPVQAHQPSSSPTALGYVDFLEYQNVPADIPPFGQQVHPGHHPNQSFLPTSSISYTFPSLSPNSSLPPESAPVSPLTGDPAQGSPNDFQFPPQGSPADVFTSDSEAVSATESRVGSFGSHESLNSSMGISIGTQPSSIAGDFVFPVGSVFNSPSMAHDIRDLTLTGEYFEAAPIMDASYSPNQMGSPQQTDTFPFDDDYTTSWASANNAYQTGYSHWGTLNVTHPQLMDVTQSLIPSELALGPWTAEALPIDHQPDAGCVAFEPAAGSPYEHFKRREHLISGQPCPVVFGPEPPSPMIEEGDDWDMVHSCTGSTVHGSPQSEGVSWCQIDISPQRSPSPRQVAGLSHMFSTHAHEPQTVKPPRGRHQPLTTKQKQEAKEVRKAGACWACHLSKIKCSPCSPGTPCQQCERLNGKRRFCLMSCFNDAIESLQPFVVPAYLTAHFDQTKIEAVIRHNATGWGKYEMAIRMHWGYEKLLEANVVALVLPPESRLAYTHQTSPTREQVMVRKKSLPLGIPLASCKDLSGQYQHMVDDIVRGDLENYVPVPYDNEESDLPESLLQIICSFYRGGLAAGQECELLRGAIAIHIKSTILERSLILDDDSKQRVERHLGEAYPPRAAANCVQRQIKFALFLAQREQVGKVLEAWGALMWSSSRSVEAEKKWATSFSVLVMVTLVVDKMVKTARRFCEGRIRHHGADAGTERRAFAELVRLTERELFERCKEIFHSSFKTRKGGREACNPIRDGLATAFQGRTVPEGISRLVWDLQRACREFGTEIKAPRTSGAMGGGEAGDRGEDYGNAGRLTAVFLGDFLE